MKLKCVVFGHHWKQIGQACSLNLNEHPHQHKISDVCRRCGTSRTFLLGLGDAVSTVCPIKKAAEPVNQGPPDAVSIQEEVLALRSRMEKMADFIHRLHGTLDSVLYALNADTSRKTWLPVLMDEAREILGITTPMKCNEFFHGKACECPPDRAGSRS